MNVFFVSNSTCYFFMDELYGLLNAAGYKDVTLALVYYSGCPLEKHYRWLCEGVCDYEFRVLDAEGLHSCQGYGLEAALQTRKWDVISFDNNSRSFSSGDVQISLGNAEPYFGQLLDRIRVWHPDARYFWHQVWANEIGYELAFKMETLEQRTRVYEAKRGVARIMEKTYGVEVVPTGDAWEKVRDLPLFTAPIPGIPMDRFTLCTRIRNGQLKDDFTHDGDIGGGQYLNACVWFEVLTGKSCIGNSFRPEYRFGSVDCSLSEEKIRTLQEAAHEAVSQWNH